MRRPGVAAVLILTERIAADWFGRLRGLVMAPTVVAG